MNNTASPRSRSIYLWVAFLTFIGISEAGIPSSAYAEALDRVYRVQANVVPTPLVAGDDAVGPTQLTLNVGPNYRKRLTRVGVQQGKNGYTIDSYVLRVKLKPGKGGGSDNGTLHYSVTANVGHNTATRSATMMPHIHGDITLHNGSGQATFPTNKYFSGQIQIAAIAAGL